MNEVVETIYQWHKGMKIQNISRSLGLDRKTVRKYVRIAGSLGIAQGGPAPDEQDLVGKLKGLLSAQACSFETPALDLITRHRDEIEKLLDDKEMTGKQVWRLLRENHGIRVGYSTIKRYLRSEFAFGRTKATVRIETPPGEEAQVDFGYAGLMNDPGDEEETQDMGLHHDPLLEPSQVRPLRLPSGHQHVDRLSRTGLRLLRRRPEKDHSRLCSSEHNPDYVSAPVMCPLILRGVI